MNDTDLRIFAMTLVVQSWLELEHSVEAKTKKDIDKAFERAADYIYKALVKVRDESR